MYKIRNIQFYSLPPPKKRKKEKKEEVKMSQCNNTTCAMYIWVTLKSRYGTSVDFDKICVFCGKCCVCSDKCVSIVVKIKCVNSGNISDICNKLNFTTNYIYFTTTDKEYIKTHINIIIFYTFGRTVPPWDLSISVYIYVLTNNSACGLVVSSSPN